MEIFKKKKRLPEPQPKEELEAAAFLPSASECAEAAAEEKASEEKAAEEKAEEAAKEAADEEKAEAPAASEPAEAAAEEAPAAEEAAPAAPAPEEEAEPLTLESLLQSMSPEGIELFRQALAEAELRGRNTAVEEHLLTADDSDGIPHPGSGNASFAAGRPTSIFDLAREAL